MTNIKIKALANFLNVDVETINEVYENTFESDDEEGEYTILTDEERDEEVTGYIKESLWAFSPSFLEGMTDIPKRVYEVLAEECEGANETIQTLIEKTCGMESFVITAINNDGYGHFLSSYDGEENEVEINEEWFYIYRTN